jgi:hypothetical protein
MKYKEANWDQIKKDLENTLTTINNIYEKSDTNILWNTFKNDIINSIESNIPHKLFTYKQRLPWINNNLRKLINKKNKYHRKKNQNPSMYKKLKHTVQKEQRFSTPLSFMWICSIIGWGLGPLSGMSCGGSCVNTDWNCWLRMFVFSTVSV